MIQKGIVGIAVHLLVGLGIYYYILFSDDKNLEQKKVYRAYYRALFAWYLYFSIGARILNILCLL